MDITEENIKRFFDFANERHAIYLRRQRGEDWPWTSNPILRDYFFTNVYRTLDKGTQWLTTNIIEPHANERELLLFNILVYRCHNRISTAERLGWISNYDAEEALLYETWMQTLADMGVHIFTGAYMVTGSVRENGVCPKSKVHQMFGITFPYVWNHIEDLMPWPGSTLEEAFKRLALHAPGIGNFVAYEIITDLRHTHFLDKAPDILTWANPGPGCRRGLGRLIGKKVMHHSQYVLRNTQECIDLMKFLLAVSPKYLAPYMPEFEMRDCEHTLCEWDKYMRVLLKEGKSRRKFINPEKRGV
jgi:hypothetical protein